MPGLSHLLIRKGLLQLQQEGRVLNFHQVADVLKPRLHQRQFALHSVISEGYLLPDYFLRRCQEVAAQQLNELVLDVLYEVQPRLSVPLIMKTARKLWGSLIQELSILIIIPGYSPNSIINF